LSATHLMDETGSASRSSWRVGRGNDEAGTHRTKPKSKPLRAASWRRQEINKAHCRQHAAHP
jgi:hypothetical protein